VLATAFGNHPTALQVPSFSEELHEMESDLEKSGTGATIGNTVPSWDAVEDQAVQAIPAIIIEYKAPLHGLTLPMRRMAGTESSQTTTDFIFQTLADEVNLATQQIGPEMRVM
jgi:hypothetical protein